MVAQLRKMNKRGWITVLEATIAVLIISGVLIVTYSKQGTDESPVVDYIFSLQKQILSDISYRSDLRSYVLENNHDEIDAYVAGKVPPAYRYSIKICPLDGSGGYCKLNETEVVETYQKNLFAEETIISAELNPDIGGDGTYQPMKVRLFIWENR